MTHTGRKKLHCFDKLFYSMPGTIRPKLFTTSAGVTPSFTTMMMVSSPAMVPMISEISLLSML